MRCAVRPLASANAASATRCASASSNFCALQQRLRLARAPGQGRNPAQCDPCVAHDAVLYVERDRRRGEREFVGLPVARLEIDRARPASGNRECGDQFAGCQRRLDLRRVAGRLVQLRERHGSEAGFSGDLDRRIERDQRLREIAGIGGDALLGGAEHGVVAIESVERGAARSRIALVAIGRS